MVRATARGDMSNRTASRRPSARQPHILRHMNFTLRRTFAASAASLIVLAGAACSNETDGEGSPSSNTSTSEESSQSSESETSESKSSESETSESSESDAPAGSETSSDGAFTYSFPEGYEDASSQLNVSSAVASAYDSSGTTFPTTIVVTKEPTQGLNLEEMADAVIGQIESSFSTTAEQADDFPLDSVDGEDLLAFTTGEYEQGGQTIASAIVLTEHDDTAYAFIVNTLAESTSEAGQKLVEFVETVQWA